MTVEPDYVIHAVDEKDVTIDWFFGEGHLATKVRQLVLVLVGWFFTLLPVVVTASAFVAPRRTASTGRAISPAFRGRRWLRTRLDWSAPKSAAIEIGVVSRNLHAMARRTNARV